MQTGDFELPRCTAWPWTLDMNSFVTLPWHLPHVCGMLNVKIGEQAAPATPLVQLADLSQWQIETDDLTELDIVRVKEGGAATLEFDAIPDLELSGKVVQIKPIGVNRQGDMTYVVVIQPEKNDPRLRWNMTTKVTIE